MLKLIIRTGLLVAVIFLVTFGILYVYPSDAHVENTSYNTLLKGLLRHSVSEISVDKVQTINKPVFFDARELEEYNISHIENAIWVGYDDFSLSRVDSIDKEKPIIVYCSIGYRSEDVSEMLQAAGYTKVYNLFGGIFEWKNQDLPIYNSKGETEEIHAYSRSWGHWLRKGVKIY